MRILPNNLAVLENDTHLSKWIEEHGKLDVDGSAHEMAMRYIKPGDVVVDGGASLGDHTTVYLGAVYPSGKVYAFEPNPAAFCCLIHNCPEAHCRRAALGKVHGHGAVISEDNNFGSTYVQRVPTVDDEAAVIIMPLDNYKLPRLDFMKLDVEGMEFDALSGSVLTISRCRPVIMIEVNHDCMKRQGVTYEQILDLMEELEYRSELRDPRYGLSEGHTDVVFLPK